MSAPSDLGAAPTREEIGRWQVFTRIGDDRNGNAVTSANARVVARPRSCAATSWRPGVLGRACGRKNRGQLAGLRSIRNAGGMVPCDTTKVYLTREVQWEYFNAVWQGMDNLPPGRPA